jgi:hypothetical protein
MAMEPFSSFLWHITGIKSNLEIFYLASANKNNNITPSNMASKFAIIIATFAGFRPTATVVTAHSSRVL